MATLAFAAVILGDSPLTAAEFRVGGELSYEFMGGEPWERSYTFEVVVKGCAWHMIVTPSASLSREYEAAYDSGETRIAIGPGNIPDLQGSPVEASISNSPVPFLAPDPIVPVLWTAFCQSCYLKKADMNALIPAFRSYVPRVALPALVSLRNDEARLPQRIVYMDDGFDHEFRRKRLAPYGVGFTNAILFSYGFTNVTKAVGVPLGFELHLFDPAPHGMTTNDLQCNYRFVGKITSVGMPKPGDRMKVALPSAKPILISDTRFGNLKAPLMYESSNGWLSVATASALPQFRAWLSSNPEMRDNISTLRSFYYIGALVLTGVLVLAYGATMRRAGKTK